MCINSQKYIVWFKMNDFYFMPKTLDIKIMFHEDIFIFPTVNISKLNFVLVICFKSFIWTNFFASSDSSFSNSCISAKYCQILTNHTSMEILFIQLSFDV